MLHLAPPATIAIVKDLMIYITVAAVELAGMAMTLQHGAQYG
ncbi:MAG TPA: hypothetical protein VF502_18630 [Stellaceae bacterium]